jgi:hypothetical protein
VYFGYLLWWFCLLLKFRGNYKGGFMVSKCDAWRGVDRYFREGVFVPIRGDYVVRGDVPFSFKCDILGGLMLSIVGPSKWDAFGLALEPGIISEFVGLYSAREVAALECLYEGRIFTWSGNYLSQFDIMKLRVWMKVKMPRNCSTKVKFKHVVDNLIRLNGEFDFGNFVCQDSKLVV